MEVRISAMILRRGAVLLISKMKDAVIIVVTDEHFVPCQEMRPARLIQSRNGGVWNNRQQPDQLAIRIGGEYPVIGSVHHHQHIIRSDFSKSGAVQLETFLVAVQRLDTPNDMASLVDRH